MAATVTAACVASTAAACSVGGSRPERASRHQGGTRGQLCTGVRLSGRAASCRGRAQLSVTACAPPSSSEGAELRNASPFGRRDLAKGALAALAAPAIAALPAGPAKADEVSKFWELVDLPLEPGIILLDIAFADAKHGFLLGTRQTILETFDGGKHPNPLNPEYFIPNPLISHRPGTPKPKTFEP